MTKLKLVETKQGNPDELTTEFEGKELYLVLKGERIASVDSRELCRPGSGYPYLLIWRLPRAGFRIY